MLASVTHILPLTKIRRLRVLPVAGKVAVRVGQNVSAADVVAQARVASGHRVLDIRRGLGVPQVSAAERCIIRQQGDRLEKGDVIAESGGLFSRIVRAPADGELVAINAGQVLLRVRRSLVEVRAGFAGTVVELIPERGAVIEADGALIQGVWGNGRVDGGLLLLIARSPDEEYTSQSVDVSMRGAVILAGHCSSADALRAGDELPLRGLILSSMTSDLIPVANSLKYPVVVIEGFGRIPLNETAYKLFMTSEKRDISINAAFDLSTGERPELVIPLPASGQSSQEAAYFAPDQSVRIQGVPYAGKIGTIIQIRQALYTLPNGLKVQAADVRFEDDSRATIPLANLEVII
jgi:hypothetical protein